MASDCDYMRLGDLQRVGHFYQRMIDDSRAHTGANGRFYGEKLTEPGSTVHLVRWCQNYD